MVIRFIRDRKFLWFKCEWMYLFLFVPIIWLTEKVIDYKGGMPSIYTLWVLGIPLLQWNDY